MERSGQPDTMTDLLVADIARQVTERTSHDLAGLGPHIQPALLSHHLPRPVEQAIQPLIFSHELPVVRVGRRVHLHVRDLHA